MKKLSQATTTVALGFAMLAAIGTDQALAVNLKSFKISGSFVSEALVGSNELSAALAGGSFTGTYTVDVDSLPNTGGTQTNLTSWSVNLLNSANNVVTTLSNTLSGNIAYIQNDFLVFLNQSSSTNYGLGFFFNDGFTGTGTTEEGRFLDISALSGGTGVGNLPLAFAKSEPVPEPLTLGGTAVAGAIGLWMKRKQKASVR